MNTEAILADEFIDELHERAERLFKGHVYEAFIDWYIEAEFGPLQWKFTDNVKDGGIDAVVWRPNDEPAVIVIQSKFHQRIGNGSLNKNAYSELNDVVRAFRSKGQIFDEWLDTVRADLKSLYRRALEKLSESRSWFQQKKAFRMITTFERFSSKYENKEIPPENFIYSDDIMQLYRQFRQGETPKARDLYLTVENKLTYRDSRRKMSSYLLSARVADFRRYLEKNDVARLVARNVRYDLASKIGSRIRSTYEHKAADFWYSIMA